MYKQIDLIKVEHAFLKVLEELNLNLEDDNLKDTPKRLAKMYTKELFKGLYNKPPEVKSFPNRGQGFLYTKVDFRSTCAHHFQNVKGVAHIFVDYSESEKVIGLSKFNRLVDHYASKPTLQEDLSVELVEVFKLVLGTPYVGIILKASHNCVTDRGVCASFSDTITEVFGTKDKNFINTCREYVGK